MNFKIPKIFNDYNMAKEETKSRIKTSIYIADIVIFSLVVISMVYILFIRGYNDDILENDGVSDIPLVLTEEQKRIIENTFNRSLNTNPASKEDQDIVEGKFDDMNKQIPSEEERQTIHDQFNKKPIN